MRENTSSQVRPLPSTSNNFLVHSVSDVTSVCFRADRTIGGGTGEQVSRFLEAGGANANAGRLQRDEARTQVRHSNEIFAQSLAVFSHDVFFFLFSIMKSVEFSTISDVSGAGASSTSGDDASGGSGSHKSLEALLLEKNKTLQSEVTSLRVANADVTG